MNVKKKTELERLIADIDRIFIERNHQCEITMTEDPATIYSLEATCKYCNHSYSVPRQSAATMLDLLRPVVGRCVRALPKFLQDRRPRHA